jgi:prepilin signal peptidase PulO-like enzyme (type II secretory pathway)
MIIILAFVGYEPQSLLSMLVGATVVFIPQLATTMLTPDRPIGGADIKISTALAFLLGAEKGIFALVVGMLFAVVITAVSNKINNRNQKQAFPLVPFLWVGATLAYMI